MWLKSSDPLEESAQDLNVEKDQKSRRSKIQKKPGNCSPTRLPMGAEQEQQAKGILSSIPTEQRRMSTRPCVLRMLPESKQLRGSDSCTSGRSAGCGAFP